uniref:Polyprenol dehydrogenase n=1 Tax=Spermophilus dauricus TaxID=99837 RepID=A0A8C9QCT2_SPEDA
VDPRPGARGGIQSALCGARSALADALIRRPPRASGHLSVKAPPSAPTRVSSRIVPGALEAEAGGWQVGGHVTHGLHVSFLFFSFLFLVAGNNDAKAQEVICKIREETLNSKVEFLYCDLGSMTSIRQFVHKFKMRNVPLHVLVNNAGVMMVPQRQTKDGFEEHLGVNYLGHFLLPNLLLDTLKDSGSPGCCARVVTVSSATHYVGELNLDDLQGSRGCYSPHGAYAQSKLALVLFTYRLQRLLATQGSHVTANVVDPGVVNTDLYRHVFWGTRLVKRVLGWLLFKEGAWTTIYAAVTPELEGVGGRYFYNEKETRSLQVTYDQKLQQQLWARSCQLTGLPDGSPGAILR